MPDDRFLHRRAGHSQKVNRLTDLEYRVWTQYILSADDFGVMRGTHHPIQNDNDHLENRPPKQIQKCLAVLVTCGLLHRFEHQGKPYVYQHDWQDWQKVEYPRRTINPQPTTDALAVCDEKTRQLFAKWPGGERRKNPKGVPTDSELTSRTRAEDIPTTRAGGPAERLTAKANGVRLAANGSEGELGEMPPMDEWARELEKLAPADGRIGWNLIERPLFAALKRIGLEYNLSDTESWEWLKARLEQHKRSHKWRIKGMVNRIDRWLSDSVFLQELSEDAPVADRLTPRTSRTLAAAAEIMREP